MNVIGLGDNVVDKYIHLSKMFPGGNALNFSVYASKLGHESAYMGVFGNDEAAKHIISVLRDIKIDISHCRNYKGENGYAKVNLVDGDRVFIYSNKGGIAREKPIKLDEADLKYIGNFDIVHTSCFSKIEEELYKIQNIDVPISFDFSNNIENEYLKKVCPHITYSFLSCGHYSLEDTKDKLSTAVEYGSSVAIATMGIKGSVVLYDNKYYFEEASKVDALDTLGAGDSFITKFLLTVLKEENNLEEEVIIKALKDGNKFAAKTCLIQGAFGYGKNI